MYNISIKVYDELASQLRDKIGTASYFSGTVSCMSGDVLVTLRTSLILYRTPDERPEGVVLRITDAVAVWWECHTEYGADEHLNDFDFGEIVSRLADSY